MAYVELHARSAFSFLRGVIYRFGCHLLARHQLVNRPLRLLGLGVSHLVPPGQQLRLPLEP